MNDTDEAMFWAGLGTPPSVADTMPKALRDANAEIADLRAQLAQVDDLRAEVARLAPGTGPIGLDEMRSIVESARRVAADYPMTDRCGCGWTSEAPVVFHRRGSDQCKADR